MKTTVVSSEENSGRRRNGPKLFERMDLCGGAARESSAFAQGGGHARTARAFWWRDSFVVLKPCAVKDPPGWRPRDHCGPVSAVCLAVFHPPLICDYSRVCVPFDAGRRTLTMLFPVHLPCFADDDARANVRVHRDRVDFLPTLPYPLVPLHDRPAMSAFEWEAD
jgi:hypothetical protein